MAFAQFADGFRHNRPDFNRDEKFTAARDLIFTALDDAKGYQFMDTEDVLTHGDVEDIEAQHRDGFIPFTNGGFQVAGFATLYSAWGSGHEPGHVKEYIDQALEDAGKACKEETGYTPNELYDAMEALRISRQPDLLTGTDTLGSRQAEMAELERFHERYNEIEREWLDEAATYFYYVRAIFYDADNTDNVTGKDEVLFCACINTDFEYGRDHIAWLGERGKCSHWVYERSVKLDEITPDLLDEIMGDIGVALATKT